MWDILVELRDMCMPIFLLCVGPFKVSSLILQKRIIYKSI